MDALNDILFRPLKVGPLELKNRIVMAPMTRMAAPKGIVGAANLAYYQRRAKGEVGLILSEGASIDRTSARNEATIPFFHGPTALNGWHAVVKAVHEAGGRMAPQLWHTGSVPGTTGWQSGVSVESPSGLITAGQRSGLPMTDTAIAETIAAYARAAAASQLLGFDAVEIHGAHGYLIDQFFWSATNLRNDKYGGRTISERCRFALEIISAVRQAVGPDFPIIFRISQWKGQDYSARIADSPSELVQWLQPLVHAGVNVLHCSQRRFWDPEFPLIDGEKGLNLAGWAKKLTGATTISVGSVALSESFFERSRLSNSFAGMDELVRRMEREEFDLIAVGRALLADPEWVAKVSTNKIGDLRFYHDRLLSTLV